jgi:hypothetical protein
MKGYRYRITDRAFYRRRGSEQALLCRMLLDDRARGSKWLPCDGSPGEPGAMHSARSCPSSFTEKGLANSVLRSTCAVLAGMRQPLARRSCTRRGLSAVIRAGNWVGDSANGSHWSIMFERARRRVFLDRSHSARGCSGRLRRLQTRLAIRCGACRTAPRSPGTSQPAFINIAAMDLFNG